MVKQRQNVIFITTLLLIILGRTRVPVKERLYERVVAVKIASRRDRKTQDEEMERKNMKSSKLVSILIEMLIHSNSKTLPRQGHRGCLRESKGRNVSHSHSLIKTRQMECKVGGLPTKLYSFLLLRERPLHDETIMAPRPLFLFLKNTQKS